MVIKPHKLENKICHFYRLVVQEGENATQTQPHQPHPGAVKLHCHSPKVLTFFKAIMVFKSHKSSQLNHVASIPLYISIGTYVFTRPRYVSTEWKIKSSLNEERKQKGWQLTRTFEWDCRRGNNECPQIGQNLIIPMY